jgi:hypothetical protein
LKIRNDRKGPIVSATFYNEYIYRIGNNGNIWFIKAGKWMELKDTVIHEIHETKLKKNISYSNDINTQPIFILEKKGKNIIIKTTTDIKNKMK